MYDNHEPNLRQIDDYNTLKGQKRRIVWAVILSGIIFGLIIMAAKTFYGAKDEPLSVSDTIVNVPMR